MSSSNKEKCLVTFLAIFLLLSIALGISLFVSVRSANRNSHHEETSQEKVCSSEGCVLLAAKLIESMDQSLNPCEDLYGFVCDNFDIHYPKPEHKTLQDVMGDLGDDATYAIKEILEEKDTGDDGTAITKARKMYNVCMNITRFDKYGLETVKKFIEELGGWPLILGSDWQSSREDLHKLVARVIRYGLDSNIFEISLAQDNKNPEKYLLEISGTFAPAGANKKQEHARLLRKDKKRVKRDLDQFGEIVQDVAKLFNSDIALNETEILGIETIGSYLNSYGATLRKKNPIQVYNKYTIGKLNNYTNNDVDWLFILNTLYEGVKTFTLEDEVIVPVPTYLRKISKLFAKMDVRSLTNYIIYEVIVDLIEHMPSAALKVVYEHIHHSPQSRWRYCITQTRDNFRHALGRLYVKDYADKTAISITEEMIGLEVKAFKDILRHSPWLSDETKTTAINKLDNIKFFIGYPSWIESVEKVDSMYEDVSISDNHFTNILELKKNKTFADLHSLDQPKNRDAWPCDYLAANAFYTEKLNAICVNIVAMNPPYVDATSLMATNFGSMGALIGHELGHGFDDTGSYYDGVGSLKEWWTERERKIYINKTTCYVEQYNQYCPNEMQDYDNSDNENSNGNNGDDDESEDDAEEEENDEENCLNGETALSENIADNVGVEIAYKAYELWAQERNVEERLPGLTQFTPRQLFFIAYAFTQCENIDEKDYKDYFEDDDYSPGKYRLIGPFDNYEDIPQSFNCTEKKQKRCKIWH